MEWNLTHKAAASRTPSWKMNVRPGNTSSNTWESHGANLVPIVEQWITSISNAWHFSSMLAVLIPTCWPSSSIVSHPSFSPFVPSSSSESITCLALEQILALIWRYTPNMDTSAFTAADWRRGGMTAGRYGSNSLPIAWQIFAQLALKYCGNIVSSGSIGLSGGKKNQTDSQRRTKGDTL